MPSTTSKPTGTRTRWRRPGATRTIWRCLLKPSMISSPVSTVNSSPRPRPITRSSNSTTESAQTARCATPADRRAANINCGIMKQLLRPHIRISATDLEGRPALADQLALADRHPVDSIAFEVEGERGPPVCIVRCPVTDDGDPVALGRDLFGREDAGGSDEFLVAPGLDGLTS